MAKLSSSNGIEKFPKLRFPEFKEPWNLVKLEDVCSYRKGRTKVKKTQYVSTENILQNYAGIEPYDDLTETEGISIQFGDTLMANIRPYLRKVWQSKFDGACSTDVLAFSPDNIDGNFLYFLIAQDRFVNYVMCGAKGSKMPRGDKNHILEYETGVPTEIEQRKIAHFIDLLNARISSQNSLINLIKKYKRGALSALFPKKGEITPQCRFAGFTEPWEQRKLGELGTVSMCRRIFKEQTSERGDIPFYKIGTFGGQADAFISIELFEEYKSKYPYPKKGDILISASGSIGRTVEFTGKNEYFQDSNIVWLNHDDRLNNSFLKCFYSIIKWAGIEGSTIKRLYNDNILNTVISLPSVDEQRKIGTFFKELDNFITLHQHKCDKLLSLKNALLQQMFI